MFLLECFWMELHMIAIEYALFLIPEWTNVWVWGFPKLFWSWETKAIGCRGCISFVKVLLMWHEHVEFYEESQLLKISFEWILYRKLKDQFFFRICNICVSNPTPSPSHHCFFGYKKAQLWWVPWRSKGMWRFKNVPKVGPNSQSKFSVNFY